MRLVVLPRLDCEALAFAPGRAFISITNPRQAPAVLPENQPILRLGFHDIESPLPGWTEMTPRHAQAVIAFVNNLSSAVDTLVIHCEHGACRSSATGLFLSAWLLAPVEWSGEGAPNPWVLHRLRQAGLRYAWAHPRLWLAAMRSYTLKRVSRTRSVELS